MRLRRENAAIIHPPARSLDLARLYEDYLNATINWVGKARLFGARAHHKRRTA
jgi:hypothetical protein